MLGYRGSQLEFSDQWIAAIARTSNGQVFFSSQMCQRWSSGKMVQFVRARVFREQLADAFIYIYICIQIIWYFYLSASYHQHRNRFPLKLLKKFDERSFKKWVGRFPRQHFLIRADGWDNHEPWNFAAQTDIVNWWMSPRDFGALKIGGPFLKQGNLNLLKSLDFMKMVGVVRCSPAGRAEPSWMCQDFFRSLVSKGVK